MLAISRVWQLRRKWISGEMEKQREMKATQLAEEFRKRQPAIRKGMEQDEARHSNGSASGSRRTRSQVAPEWTVQDSLVLVNEIAAVEGDCANVLSSYQKWAIIAENCTALEVVRTAYQCRRKWDSLLGEYQMIKEWQMRSSGSYWSLQRERRKRLGLQVDFDAELYKAISEVAKAQEGRSDTEPDSDPEAEIDLLEPKESVYRRPRHQSDHQKVTAEGKDYGFLEEDSAQRGPVGERGQLVMHKLQENADMIHAILSGEETENEESWLSDLRNEASSEIERARQKADKLLVFLGNLGKHLEQLYNVVELQRRAEERKRIDSIFVEGSLIPDTSCKGALLRLCAEPLRLVHIVCIGKRYSDYCFNQLFLAGTGRPIITFSKLS
ncbi:hypothetical protein Dimus_010821, partial [Dionaea muscipula]